MIDGLPASPLRTCLGCRKRHPKKTLLRFVTAKGGRLKVDVAQRAVGRGAYTCLNNDCLTLAWRRGAFTRALRHQTIPIALEQLLQQVTSVEVLQLRGSDDARKANLER